MSIDKKSAYRFKDFINQTFDNQTDAASFLNVSQGTISNFCNGKRSVPDRVLRSLAIRKNLNINWYFIGRGPMLSK